MSRLTDWDDAYSNGAYIAGADSYPAVWSARAQAFRDEIAASGRARLDPPYGGGQRQRLDLFLPPTPPKGLAVFVHGGYWLAFDKSSWSHLARGPLEAGWAVALPSYTLAPGASLATITGEIGQAISCAAGMIEGPIRLAGHSAGGHLVTRMVCRGAPLTGVVQARIAHVVSISGIHDLRPLLRTAMGARLFRHPQEAAAESPALLEPIMGARVTCWVGAGERPEFLRQAELLANIWRGLGAETACFQEPDSHHFNVIDGLSNPDSSLTRAILG